MYDENMKHKIKKISWAWIVMYVVMFVGTLVAISIIG